MRASTERSSHSTITPGVRSIIRAGLSVFVLHEYKAATDKEKFSLHAQWVDSSGGRKCAARPYWLSAMTLLPTLAPREGSSTSPRAASFFWEDGAAAEGSLGRRRDRCYAAKPWDCSGSGLPPSPSQVSSECASGARSGGDVSARRASQAPTVPTAARAKVFIQVFIVSRVWVLVSLLGFLVGWRALIVRLSGLRRVCLVRPLGHRSRIARTRARWRRR